MILASPICWHHLTLKGLSFDTDEKHEKKCFFPSNCSSNVIQFNFNLTLFSLVYCTSNSNATNYAAENKANNKKF